MNSTEHNIAQPVQGHFLQPCSKFSQGKPRHVLGDQQWVVNCGYCERTTVSLLTLDVADKRLELGTLPVPTLPLLACRKHFQTAFQYSFTTSGTCVLVENEGADFLASLTDDVLVVAAPQPVLLHAIPDRVCQSRLLAQEGRIEEAEGWAKRFVWDQPQHQVGGPPFRLNKMTLTPNCSSCGQLMPFLASTVVNVRNGLKEETGFGQMLFHLCRTCACVAVTPDFKTDDYS